MNINEIKFFSHNIAKQGLTKEQVFGVRGGRNDGVHLNGPCGEEAYRKSLVEIMKKSLISRQKEQNTFRRM